MTRLKRFVTQRLRKTYPEQDEQERLIKAGELVEEMKRDGIDPRFFGQAAVLFSSWCHAKSGVLTTASPTDSAEDRSRYAMAATVMCLGPCDYATNFTHS
jgi:hypothetical protein